jgi:hypothetical protein
MGGTCNTHQGVIEAYNFLVGKSEIYRSLGRTRRRWADNSNMDLKQGMRLWSVLIWSRIGSSVGLL